MVTERSSTERSVPIISKPSTAMASSSMDLGHAGRGTETDWEAITESEMKDKLARGATTHNGEATASEVEVEGESPACREAPRGMRASAW